MEGTSSKVSRSSTLMMSSDVVILVSTFSFPPGRCTQDLVQELLPIENRFVFASPARQRSVKELYSDCSDVERDQEGPLEDPILICEARKIEEQRESAESYYAPSLTLLLSPWIPSALAKAQVMLATTVRFTNIFMLKSCCVWRCIARLLWFEIEICDMMD
jgi:hypothetical protein